MEDLDRLRGQSKWVDAEHLARLILASHNSPIAAVTIAEAETYRALTALDPATDSVSAVKPEKLSVAAKLINEATPDDASNFEYLCAKAHLFLLSNDPKEALQTLQSTKVHIARNYQRAMAVKHRALMGSALLALSNPQDAVSTFKSIEVSDETLHTLPEASRWAEILYNKAIEASSATGSADRLAFLRAYAYVVNTGEIVGRKQHLQALETELAQLEQTETVKAERGAVQEVLANLPVPSAKSPIGSSCKQLRAVASPLSPSTSHLSVKRDATSPSGAKPDTSNHHHGLFSRLRRHHHAESPKPTKQPVQTATTTAPTKKSVNGSTSGNQALNRDMSVKIEDQAQKLYNDWLASAKLHEPFNVALGPDKESAKALQAKIIGFIGQTFNSAVLMRLNCQLLYSLGQFAEAKAAFKAFVMLQGQQILKKESGAESFPDTEAGVVKVFSLRASVIETMPNSPYGYEIVDAAAELVSQLETVMPRQDREAISAAHGVLARCATMEALRAEGNDYYHARLDAAAKHYEKALVNWAGDLPFHRARAQFLLFTDGPAATFQHLQSVLSSYPDDIVLINELIVCLTAQEQFDTALKIAEVALESKQPQADLTPFEKTQFLNLKKSHVAVLESLHGSTAALEELPAVMDLAASLFPAAAMSAAAMQTANGKANGHANGHANGQDKNAKSATTPRKPKRRPTLEFTTDEPAHGFTVNLLAQAETGYNSKTPADLVDLWLWIASLYARAGQTSEAEAAIKVAAVAGRTANVICAEAYLISDPHEQFAAFQRAHSYDPMSLRAVLGLAVVMSEHTVISEGKATPGSSSKLCETTTAELDLIQALVSSLEDMTTRALGRQTPEAWYLLGTLYSVLGDHDRARQSLWQCVSVEEKTGVRHIIPSLQL